MLYQYYGEPVEAIYAERNELKREVTELEGTLRVWETGTAYRALKTERDELEEDLEGLALLQEAAIARAEKAERDLNGLQAARYTVWGEDVMTVWEERNNLRDRVEIAEEKVTGWMRRAEQAERERDAAVARAKELDGIAWHSDGVNWKAAYDVVRTELRELKAALRTLSGV